MKTDALPLSGIKVLDLSRVLAGPLCTQIFGDMGADVIKIEERTKGDDTRAWGPPYWKGTSVYYLSVNRNKRSVGLNFKDPKDLERVRSLAREADILVENFRVGDLKKYRLDYESLAEINPRLIYVSISGFGQTGPRAHQPGYDLMIQAMSGLMSITGPNAETPTKVGVAVADVLTGLYACIAALSALHERSHSSQGQHCDLSILDVQVSSLMNIAMNYLATKEIPHPLGNAHPSIVPYQVFATKDKAISLAIGNDHQFQNLSEAIGESELANEARFSTNEMRVQNRQVLAKILQEKLRTKPRAEWIKIFENYHFPFGPVQNLEEVAEDPQTIARELFTTMSDGAAPCLRSPLRFSRTPIKDYRTPPKLNQNEDAQFDS